jgi:hypothetical protein
MAMDFATPSLSHQQHHHQQLPPTTTTNNYHHQLPPTATNYQQQHTAVTMQATTNNTGSSAMSPPSMPLPLMRLPGELRNQIYREYFNSVITQGTEDLHELQSCLNILHVNREVRSEAGSIFYEEYVRDPNGPFAPAYSHQRWEITASSKKSQVQRMSAFCRSLVEYKVTDANIALQFEKPGLSGPISPRFVEALTSDMIFQLGDGTENSPRTAVHSKWERHSVNIPGTAHRMSILLLTRTFAEFTMIYHYSRSNDQEHFTLVGPLAKIDWRGFLGFEFLGPMDVLELRGEVAIWFAKNMNLEHGEQTYQDSWQMPGMVNLWATSGGSGHRTRSWSTISQMLMAVYVAPDGVFEMAKTFTLTGPKRRNSTHGDKPVRCLHHARGSAPFDVSVGDKCEGEKERRREEATSRRND